MIQPFLNAAKQVLDATKPQFVSGAGERGVRMPDGTFYPWRRKGNPSASAIADLERYHQQASSKQPAYKPYTLTHRDGERGVFMEDGAFYPWTKKVHPTSQDLDGLRAYHEQTGKWEYSAKTTLDRFSLPNEYVPGSLSSDKKPLGGLEKMLINQGAGTPVFKEAPAAPTPKTKAALVKEVQKQAKVSPYSRDPWEDLPFTQKDFQDAVDQGLSFVRVKGTKRSIPITSAMRQVATRTGVTRFDAQKSAGQVETESHVQDYQPGGAQRFGQGNPNAGKGFSDHLVERYMQTTGLTENDAPYAAVALRMIGGVLDAPAIASQGYREIIDPKTRDLGKFALDTIASVNLFDPSIDGPERFSRFLNAAFAIGGSKHSVSRIKELASSPSLVALADASGIKRSEISRLVDIAATRAGSNPRGSASGAASVAKVTKPEKGISVSGSKHESGKSVAINPATKPKVQKSAEGIPFTEQRMDPKDIQVREGLQYKKAGITDSVNAVSDDLKGVQKFDLATAGPLTVWETADGKRHVMNGHHRRELAIRTGEPEVSVRVFREADGVTFEKARAFGALQNIRDGKGTAIDAATVLRDLKAPVEQLAEYGLNTRRGVAKDAISLLKLDENSLKLVADGQVPESLAAGIADAGLDPKRQLAVMKLAIGSGLETRNQGSILAERARKAPLVDRTGGSGDLFGELDESLALAEQAKLTDNAMRRLSQSQRALTAFERAKVVGSTFIDKDAQSQAASIQEFGRKVLATDEKAASIIQSEAEKYARNPTKKQLEQSTEAIVRAAEDAAERRLDELNPRRLGKGPADGDGGRNESTQSKPRLAYNPPRPKKGLSDMSQSELDSFREEVRAFEIGKGSKKSVLGEKYDSWKKLDGDADFEGIEKLLTPDEWEGIYGRAPGQIFLDEVDSFITDTNAISTARTAKELGFWLRSKLANPHDNVDSILAADRVMRERGWNIKEVEDAAITANAMLQSDMADTAYLYGKSLTDVVDSIRRTNGERVEQVNMNPALTGDKKGQYNIFTDPDGTLKANSGIDIGGVLKNLNDLDYKYGDGSFKTDRGNAAKGYGVADRFRMPLSIIDGSGETLQMGTYERLGGPLGKKVSKTIREAQIEIDRLSTEWTRAMDGIESVLPKALKQLAQIENSRYNVKTKKHLTSKLIDLIESDLVDNKRSVKGPLGDFIQAHDQLTDTLRSYIIESRRSLGIETPDNWGITEQGYFRHLFLGDIRLIVDGKFRETYRTYAEAQKAAVDVHRENPAAKIVAQARVHKGGEDVLRVSTKRYAKIASGLADSIDVPMSEIMKDLSGEIGQRSKKLKFFGALKQRTGVEGFSRDYIKVMRAHVVQVARTQELSKLNRAVIPLIEKIRGEGLSGLADAMVGHLDSIWGTPTEFERTVGASIRKTPILRNYVGAPDFAMRGLANRLTKLQTLLKLSFNVKSATVNLLQPYSTLWPYIKTADMVKLYGDVMRKETRKMLKERGVWEGDTKLEETVTGIRKKRSTPFQAASSMNRAIGYLYGYRKGQRDGLREYDAHKSGLAWAEKVEFDNSAWNGAPVFRSSQGRVLGQFKGFMFKNLEHFIDAASKKEGDSTLTRAGRIAKLTTAQMGVGGVKGLGVVGSVFGGYKITEFLAEQMMQNGMSKEEATELAELVYYGAPSLIGEDLSASVAILEPPYGRSIPEKVVNAFFGPTVDMMAKVGKEVDAYISAEDKQGEYGTKGLSAKTKRQRSLDKAASAITPYWKQLKAGWNLIQSEDGTTRLVLERPSNEDRLQRYAEGEHDMAKDIVLTPFESVMLSLGFTPLKQTRYYDRKESKIGEGVMGSGESNFQRELGQAVGKGFAGIKPFVREVAGK